MSDTSRDIDSAPRSPDPPTHRGGRAMQTLRYTVTLKTLSSIHFIYIQALCKRVRSNDVPQNSQHNNLGILNIDYHNKF